MPHAHIYLQRGADGLAKFTERERQRQTRRKLTNLPKNKTSSLRVMISLLLLMFKPISNCLQIISRQVQRIGGSQEPAASLHTSPSSFRWQVPGLLGGKKNHRRWERKESRPQRGSKDFLTTSCHCAAGTQHSGKDSGWEKDSSSSSKVPGQGQPA